MEFEGRGEWMWYVGTRRPSSLADQGEYAEITHAKQEPIAGTPVPRTVDGESMTGRGKE